MNTSKALVPIGQKTKFIVYCEKCIHYKLQQYERHTVPWCVKPVTVVKPYQTVVEALRFADSWNKNGDCKEFEAGKRKRTFNDILSGVVKC